jgi:hypothetical protein
MTPAHSHTPGTVTTAGSGAADWLSLCAAPTFAVMALLSSLLGSDASAMLCMPAHHALPLTGMVPMYVLMTAFHSGPWLKLIARCRHPHRAPRGTSGQCAARAPEGSRISG